MSDDHRPLLTIDLAAVAENYSMLREHVGDAACGASIKADCYGLGMTDVAPTLFSAGCKDFFVASLDEAIEARRVMPEAAIHVLFGPARFDRGLYVEHDLIPVLNSLPQIEEWLARSDAEAGRPVILHLDTGMARLGLDTEDVRRLLDDRQILARLNVSLLMSHLACADEPDNEMNRRQLSAFETVRRQMVGSLSTRPRISFANSSGIFLGPEYHFDQVRPGAALYGLNPIPGHPNPMHPVVHLLAPILQVRAIDAGKCVGYGATHRASRPTRLATVAIGYADGLMRSLSNRGVLQVGEFSAPIVGRVSMDLMTIDVGHVPEHLARPGAMVEILGSSQDADELGRSAGTIGYEVLTALGRRCRRVHRKVG